MRLRHLAAASTAAVLCAGCSLGGSAHRSGADPTLQADVLALTQAAATSDWSAAHDAMSRLRSDLSQAVSTGSISAARAASIRSHLAEVAADVAARTRTTAPAPTTSTPAPAPKPKPKPKPKPPPKHHDKHGGGGGDQGGGGGD